VPVLLVLTLVRGLLYLAVVPPWQHYDEPTHFEYVRLIAKRGRLPRPGDYDPEIQREIAASSKAPGWWQGMAAPTHAFWSDGPINLGYSELVHPPLYYLFLALPQPLAAHQSVEAQLYLARLGSVLLSLLIVAAAYGLVTELLPGRRWLPLVVASFVAMLPTFTDLVSAVNNDVGAIAAATLLLWAAVRLLRRGPSLWRVGAVLVLTGLCVATKNTSTLVALPVLLALGVAHIPKPGRRWLGMGLCLLCLGALPLVFTWDRHAAHWIGYDRPTAASRIEVRGPLGRSALVLSPGHPSHPRILVQELSQSDGRELRGHTVTLGAWLKAAEGTGETVALTLWDGTTDHRHQIEVTTDWQFHAFTATIALDAPSVAVYITLPYSGAGAHEVYADGIVLLDGQMPTDLVPQFDTDQAEAGTWGGQAFANLLHNGSAERVWPGLEPWIGKRRLYTRSAAMIFHSLWDWSRTREVYGFEVSYLFRSFWGRFGWSHLELPPACFYVLGLLTTAAAVGVAVGLVHRVRSSMRYPPWRLRAWLVLGLALLAGWGGTVLRIHPVFFVVQPIWAPVARYAAVVLVPTAALLFLGLAKIVPRRWAWAAAYVGLLGMVVLDAIALWKVILPYYYG
jgi:hypothetical protein